MVANTITQPGTVVVHLRDTYAADAAVVSSLGFPVAARDTVVFISFVWRHLRYYFWSSD